MCKCYSSPADRYSITSSASPNYPNEPIPLHPPSRVILSSSLLTHQIVLRSAIQCHLLRTAAKLSDLKVVGFNDIASLLGSLKSTESIAFNTTAWREVI